MNDLKLASEISRSIWGYVISTFSLDSDDVPPSEVAFTYSIYHYAVLDILKRYHLHYDVLDVFAPSAAFLFQIDLNDPALYPAFAIMSGQVSSTIRFFETDNLSPTSIDGARKIISQKYIICHDLPKSTYDSFMGYQPTDTECHRYVKNTNDLRSDVERIILTSTSRFDNVTSDKDSDSYKEYKPEKHHNFLLYFCAIVLAVFILYGSYFFFFAT